MTEVERRGTEQEVFERLRAILADVLVLDEDEIQVSSKLVDDLDADSIGFLEITWRIRQEFGVQIPEVKVDEETLTMSLTDGLERIGAQAGGVTLFEFMQNAAADSGDSRFGERAVAMLERVLLDEGFPERLRAALAEAKAGSLPLAAVASLLREVRETPALSAAWATMLKRAPDLAPELVDVDRAAGADESRALDALPVWTSLLDSGPQMRELFDLRVRDFGEMMGSGVPEGLDPDGELSALILRDLFRFITVDAYVQYVLFLRESQSRDA
jgi:acyl carrier protein